jgi:hypothetical protein
MSGGSVRIEVTERDSPVFGGAEFGAAREAWDERQVL